MISVFIAGDPAPQGSKRHVGNGRMIEASKHVAPWRADVRAALTEEDGKPKAFFDGPVQVIAQFVLRRPKSAPKRRAPTADKKPDLDKLLRAVLDAVSSAGVWNDDSQAVQITAEKAVAGPSETPGLYLHIHRWETVARS